jgi:hypothetical protein
MTEDRSTDAGDDRDPAPRELSGSGRPIVALDAIVPLYGRGGAVLLVGTDASALGDEAVARRGSGRLGVLVVSPGDPATASVAEEMLEELFGSR